MNETVGLGALLLSSFTSATLLPGTSEWVLTAVLASGVAGVWPALAVATFGNTAGGMTSFVLGRIVPKRVDARALERIARFGAVALLLSWVPVIGDALCVAAGWLRVNPWLAALYMALGKFARYWLIAQFAV